MNFKVERVNNTPVLKTVATTSILNGQVTLVNGAFAMDVSAERIDSGALLLTQGQAQRLTHIKNHLRVARAMAPVTDPLDQSFEQWYSNEHEAARMIDWAGGRGNNSQWTEEVCEGGKLRLCNAGMWLGVQFGTLTAFPKGTNSKYTCWGLPGDGATELEVVSPFEKAKSPPRHDSITGSNGIYFWFEAQP